MQRAHRDERGQTIVLVALLMLMLLGFTGLAIDGGRFYAERRYLQNASDAAALACAHAKVSGLTDAQSTAQGLDVFNNQNLLRNPIGLTVTVPSTAVYSPDALDFRNLQQGVILTTRGCRAAVTTTVPFYFGQLLGLGSVTAFAESYAVWNGGFIPAVSPRWENQPGPGGDFHDHTKQSANDSTNCAVGSPDNCPDATDAAPGREFVLMGSGAKADNDNSFRGNIVLDIRQFDTSTHAGYNGVDGGTNPDTVKAYEAAWITAPGGYPGPPICVVNPSTSAECAQIATTSGNTSGTYISSMDKRYAVNDYVMLQLYDGLVKTIPNFTLSPPSSISIGTTQTVSPGNITVSGTTQFRPTGVTISVTSDTADLNNPVNTSDCTRGTLGTGYATTNFTSTWTNMTCTGAAQGIYAIYIHGAADAPYQSETQNQLVILNVGNQGKDFNTGGSSTTQSVDPVGPVASYTLNFKAVTGWNTAVTLTYDSCPAGIIGLAPYNCYFSNNTGLNTTTVTPSGGNGTDITANVVTAGLATGGQDFTIRATGTDGSGHNVTHLIRMHLDAGTASGGATQYVQVIGYALFKVTAIDSNAVSGTAVTGLITDPTDPRLAKGLQVVLVPWPTTP